MDINYPDIIKDIKPKKWEKKEVEELSSHLINVINDIASKKNIDAEAVLVGSVAKDTWLSGNADVDIFIKFPLKTSESYLKEKGLYLGSECMRKMGGSTEYRYASHPYVTGLIKTFEIDFVPCYDIRNTKKIKSAVDRTIPHTEYVKNNLIPGKADEVLLLKKFMDNINAYGSEFKVGGFAGYLCELLIIHYGTFLNVLKYAADEWKPGYQIDMENYGTANLFTEPLIVVDPVDPHRNVAAALSLQTLSEFVVASRNYLENPSTTYFYDKEIQANQDEVKKEFEERGTKTLILHFRAPDIPADALYPQIKKTANSIVSVVERSGFKTWGSDYWTDEKDEIIILLEFEIWKLPQVKKHHGPPVWSKEHGANFQEKYGKKVWIEGDQWVVDVDREYTEVDDLLKAVLSMEKFGLLKFGKHIKGSILNWYELMDVKEFLAHNKVEEGVLEFLYKYLHKNLNLWG
ncbi:MAG TPA: CCA tRNA nucleotidyltransferase [Methanobacterium sp.]|nr:CCA tRNA nucleotidyltransferase [Methanobacterium sp.]